LSKLIEAWFERLYHVEPLDLAEPDIALRIAFQRYSGKAFTLADGTAVQAGDRVIEMHMRNDLLAKLHDKYGDPGRVGLAYYCLLRRAMQRMARLWREGPRLEGVVATYGVSIFPEHLERAGFELREVESPLRRALVGRWSRNVVAGGHPRGRERVFRNGKPRGVVEVWMSRSTCLRLFGKAEADLASEDVGEPEGE
jgi:peptidoglycan-N-acetylglucosamine deacetylase